MGKKSKAFSSSGPAPEEINAAVPETAAEDIAEMIADTAAEAAEDAAGTVAEALDEAVGNTEEIIEEAVEKAEEAAAETVEEAAGDIAETAAEFELIEDTVDEAANEAKDIMEEASEEADDLPDDADDILEDEEENAAGVDLAAAAEAELAGEEKKPLSTTAKWLIGLGVLCALFLIIIAAVKVSDNGRINRTTAAINDLEHMVNKLQSDYKTAQTELEASRNELEAVNGELAAARDDISSLQTELESIGAELTSAKAELYDTKEALATAGEVNEKLQLTVNELTAAAEDIQASLNAVKEKVAEEAAKSEENGFTENRDFWSEKQQEADESVDRLNSLLEDIEGFTAEEEPAEDPGE